jgi:undecaprenyl-diphosphatase
VKNRIRAIYDRIDSEILGGVVLLFLLLWAFVGIADEVSDASTMSVDERILLAFRDGQDLDDPLGPPWVSEMVRDLTALGSWVIIAVIVASVVIYLLLQKRPRSVLFLLVAVIGGVVLGQLLKSAFGRPRPDIVPHMVSVLSESFPSGHSTISAVVYPTLGAMLSRVVGRVRVRVYLLVLGITLSLVVGFTRVYMGVHYPTDVLAGWAVGFAWALGCWLAVTWMQRRQQVEPAPPTKHGVAEEHAADA